MLSSCSDFRKAVGQEIVIPDEFTAVVTPSLLIPPGYEIDPQVFKNNDLEKSNDNFNLKSSHFYAALLKKIYLSKFKNKKKLVIWGTGKAKRELMFVDDLADAILFFMKKKIKQPFINIGTGKEQSILWYAKYIMKKMNIKLKVKFDKTKPDGMQRKCLDVSIAKRY